MRYVNNVDSINGQEGVCMADHSEDTQTQSSSEEKTKEEILAERRKKSDETFQKAKEFLRKYFHEIARQQKGMKDA